MFQLTDKDSFPFVDDSVDRHVRLCAQIVGGDKYSAAINVPYDNLIGKLDARKKARRNVSGAIDIIELHNDAVNSVIRKVQGRAKEFDSANLGAKTAVFLLPNGNITPVIEEKTKDKPEKAHEIALKISSLGNTHTLFPLAAELDEAANALTAKLKLKGDAEKAYLTANTEAYVAKVALVKQYNANYFDAAHDVSKEYAEKLFPRIIRRPDNDDKDNGITPPNHEDSK